jgi:DNA polymerase-3 subunit beta
MKFTIKKHTLRDIMSKVQGLTSRKTNLAITQNVLIKAEGSGVTIMATDLETGFTGEYPAEIESEGIIAVNSKKLHEIVREFPVDYIHVEEKENRRIDITDQKVEYHIWGMNPEDFPESPIMDEFPTITVDMATFRKMIERTNIVAAASDENRAHILGTCFSKIQTEAGENLFRLASTDSNRLSLVDTTYENELTIADEKGVLVPKKSLHEVAKFIDGEGTVQIGLTPKMLLVKKENETLIARIIEGDFPFYGHVMENREGEQHLKIERNPFLNKLKRMSILTAESYNGVIFKFDEGKLEILASNPELGESREDIGIDYVGDTLEIAFNPRYFIDTLNVIQDEIVFLDIVDSNKPCFVKGAEDQGFLSIIMPMQI